MGFRNILFMLVLQIALSSIRADIITVVDVEADLSQPAIAATYHELASTLPTTLPTEIRTSANQGIWLFKEETEGGLFVLASTTKFDKITLKVYSTVPVRLYFEDKTSNSETPEPAVTIPATVEAKWTDHSFSFVRENASTEIFTLRIQITPTAGKAGLFLVDSISIIETEVEATTEAGSAAIAPTLITFLTLAILKTFM